MKSFILKVLGILVFFIFPQASHAQTFTGTADTIPDTQNGNYFPIQVSGLPNHLTSSLGLKKICVNILHNRVTDLGITLYDPSGSPVVLSMNNGVSGANYTNTCFEMTATQFIQDGIAPMTGIYRPQYNLGLVNNGQNPNGIWRLFVNDFVADTIAGRLLNWALNFDTNAPLPLDSLHTPCSVITPQLCICPDTSQQNCVLFPDIILSENYLHVPQILEQSGQIKIGTSSGNIGYGPLELIGTNKWFCGDSLVSGTGLCPDGTYAKQQVKQRLYVKTPWGYFDYIDTLVGYMSFHADLGHHHLHIENWSENTIRLKGPEADPNLWPILAKGEKISFNIYDHVFCDPNFLTCVYDSQVHVFGEFTNRGLGLKYASGSAYVQGLSVGFADVYGKYTTGQSVPLDSTFCNGDYYIVSTFDPKNQFVEQNKKNNSSFSKVTLTQQKRNCCVAKFEIKQVDSTQTIYQFIDRSKPIPTAWHWDFGDGDTSNLQFPIHTFTKQKPFLVTLKTNSDSCSSVTSTAIQTGLTPEFENSKISYSIFPNPNRGVFQVKVSNQRNQLIQTKMQNSLGQTIAEKQFEGTSLEENFHLSPGLYFYRIQIEDKFYTEKILIQ